MDPALYGHQHELLGAKLLYEKDQELQEEALDSLSDGNATFNYEPWEKLPPDYQEYWIKLFQTVMPEIGKLYREESDQRLREINEQAQKMVSGLKSKRQALADHLTKTKAELMVVNDQLEEGMRGVAAMAYLRDQYEKQSPKDFAVQDILFGDVTSLGFKKWYDGSERKKI